MAYAATVSHSCLIVAYETRAQPYVAAPLLAVLILLGLRGARYFLGRQSGTNATDSKSSNTMVMLPPLVLAAPFVVRLLVFPSPLTPVLLRWAASFACACSVWLLQLPERFFPPGTFDLIGNSHNLMHVLVLVVYRELNQGIDALVAQGLSE